MLRSRVGCGRLSDSISAIEAPVSICVRTILTTFYHVNHYACNYWASGQVFIIIQSNQVIIRHFSLNIEDGPCLGWRGGPNEEYIWLKYSEVEERATAFGAGLANLGIEPGQDSYVGIFCPNMPEVSIYYAAMIIITGYI